MSLREKATAAFVGKIVKYIQEESEKGSFELDLNDYDNYSSDLDDAIINAVNDPDFKIEHGIASW